MKKTLVILVGIGLGICAISGSTQELPTRQGLAQQICEEYSTLKNQEYKNFLKKIKKTFNLDAFLDIEYYESMEEMPSLYKWNVKEDSYMWTLPVHKTEKGIVVWAGPLYYIGKGYKPICIIDGKASSKLNYYDFMSALIDHEYEHAKAIKTGLKYRGKEISINDMRAVVKDDGTDNKTRGLYTIITEIIAYNHQLEDGLFSNKISEKFKNTVAEGYLDYYLGLWDYDDSSGLIPALKSEFFYINWIGKLVDIVVGDNNAYYLKNRKNGKIYPLSPDVAKTILEKK